MADKFTDGDGSIDADWLNVVDHAVVQDEKYVPLDGSKDMTGNLTVKRSSSTQIISDSPYAFETQFVLMKDGIRTGRMFNSAGVDSLVFQLFDSSGSLLGNMSIDPTGNLQLSATSPSLPQHLTRMDFVQKIAAIISPPASAASTGTAGNIAFDSTYFYVCIATNSWKRVAIAAW